MWLIALFGMATKYAEAVCAVSYREVDKSGRYVGGPMYYLRNGVGEFAPELGKWLGLAFAVFGAVAAFGIGNAVQVNSMASALGNSFGVPTWLTGVVVAALVGVVVIGGIRRIGEVAGKLVPAMIVLYLGAAIIIIIINIAEVPAAFGMIFTHAFTPAAATGGFAGAAVAAAIRFGVARGVFSNESGLGSAAIAHAAAQTNSPVRQGVIAMLGTFIDTIVVCTMTALVILTSGAWMMTGADGGGLTGAVLTSTGFQSSMAGGQYIVTVALTVFAFTTILGWSYYGERCWQYLFSENSLMIYRAFWVLAALAFANVKVDFVWNLSDTLNGLMAVPNSLDCCFWRRWSSGSRASTSRKSGRRLHSPKARHIATQAGVRALSQVPAPAPTPRHFSKPIERADRIAGWTTCPTAGPGAVRPTRLPEHWVRCDAIRRSRGDSRYSSSRSGAVARPAGSASRRE